MPGFIAHFFRGTRGRAVALLLAGSLASAAAQDGHYIMINQLGFRIRDEKTAVVFGGQPTDAAFEVCDAKDGAIAWRGATKVIESVSWGQFRFYGECDFSAMQKPGRYVLRVGRAVSASFAIADDVYAGLADESLEFMREQRCGYNPFLDQTCHQLDGRTAYGPLTNGTYLDCAGGWHDGGDLLKYLLTSGNATAQMLLAWQLAGGAPIFNDTVRADEQGRRANRVPDILDEARWGLEWMLKLHHPRRTNCITRWPTTGTMPGGVCPRTIWLTTVGARARGEVVYFADGETAGVEIVSKRIDRGGEPGGTLCGGDGAGGPGLQG